MVSVRPLQTASHLHRYTRQIYHIPGIGIPVVTATDGPIPQSGNIVPQMFLSFRGASQIYLNQSTKPLMLSSVNTISTHISHLKRDRQFLADR
jgi:hypothetical protein